MAEKKKAGAVALGQTEQPAASPGAEAPEAEFLAAVERFTSAPMSGAIKKEAGK